uniref:Prolyl 4-hydroxylase alpha subunit domain-containing protein n=1 Tax=Timema cristinae TaxID=61476 RepID=A0A7R9H7I4_TIMCR|nr:unnamed protein product [Timema cristinae]
MRVMLANALDVLSSTAEDGETEVRISVGYSSRTLKPRYSCEAIMATSSRVILACLLLMVSRVNCEVYTALVEMEELLETEAVLMRTLEDYITAQEDRLNQLRSQDVQGYLSNPINAYLLVKRLTTDWKQVESFMVDDITQGFAENLTRYHQILKFPSDEDLNGAAVALMRLQDTYKLDTSSVARGELNGIQYSTELTGAEWYSVQHRAYRSVQSVQELNGIQYSTELTIQNRAYRSVQSVQELNGIQYRREETTRETKEELGGKDSSKCATGDCFELGRQSYNNGDFYHTVLWMTEALGRYQDESNKTTTKSDILEYLAFSTYMQGNVHRALKLTDELLEILPNHERAVGNKVYYLQDLEKRKKGKKRGEDGADDTPADEPYTVTEKRPQPLTDLPERDLYEMLCRGDVTLPDSVLSQLKCSYVDGGVPFLKLARVKMEEAFHKPRIVIYHDVIYDSEIATIKRLAQPRFRRATVQNYQTGQLEVAHYRISKSAWLKEEDHEHVARVNQRAEDLTSLTVATAEELQVVNYGIGGHYEPHFDFARVSGPTHFNLSCFNYSVLVGVVKSSAMVVIVKSSAMVMIVKSSAMAVIVKSSAMVVIVKSSAMVMIVKSSAMMSDVEQGGATVFPAIHLALYPKKGTAAFWYNLHPNGEGDYLTRHAACPVLTGSKWGLVLSKLFRRACDAVYRDFQNKETDKMKLTSLSKDINIDSSL